MPDVEYVAAKSKLSSQSRSKANNPRLSEAASDVTASFSEPSPRPTWKTEVPASRIAPLDRLCKSRLGMRPVLAGLGSGSTSHFWVRPLLPLIKAPAHVHCWAPLVPSGLCVPPLLVFWREWQNRWAEWWRHRFPIQEHAPDIGKRWRGLRSHAPLGNLR